MTADPTPCPCCNRAPAETLHYAVGVMMAAASFARRNDDAELAAALRQAYTELLLLITPDRSAEAGPRLRAA